MTISRSVVAWTALLFPAMVFPFRLVFLLSLQFEQILVQAIEALFPEAPVAFEPVHRILKRLGLEPAGAPLRLAPARNQPRALQRFEMLGNGRQAHLEGLGQLGDRGLAGSET